MQTELLELIKKSLPSMQVDALKVELEKAARVPSLESKIVNLEKNLKETEDKHSQSLTRISEMSKEIADQKDLERRERSLKITLLEKEVSLINQSKSDLFELMKYAFRNPVIVHSKDKPVTVKDSMGNQYVQTHIETETVTQE